MLLTVVVLAAGVIGLAVFFGRDLPRASQRTAKSYWSRPGANLRASVRTHNVRMLANIVFFIALIVIGMTRL